MLFLGGVQFKIFLKKWGFIKENPQKHDFSPWWGFIQEWGYIEADTVVIYTINSQFRESTIVAKDLHTYLYC